MAQFSGTAGVYPLGATWKLKAYKYYYIPWKDIGLAGIVIRAH